MNNSFFLYFKIYFNIFFVSYHYFINKKTHELFSIFNNKK